MERQSKEIEISEPRLVKSHDVKLDAEYAEWIAEVKHRYRSAQVKAAVKVNGEKLLFNWQMGRDLVQKKAEERWGAGVVEQVSLDMQKEFPESKNFSVRNLWYMKQWFLFYTENMRKLKQLVSEMLPSEEYKRKLEQIDEDENEKLKQPVSEFPSAFACVPWGHHVRIVQHSETIEEALFYVGYTILSAFSSARTLFRNCVRYIYRYPDPIPSTPGGGNGLRLPWQREEIMSDAGRMRLSGGGKQPC